MEKDGFHKPSCRVYIMACEPNLVLEFTTDFGNKVYVRVDEIARIEALICTTTEKSVIRLRGPREDFYVLGSPEQVSQRIHHALITGQSPYIKPLGRDIILPVSSV